MGPPGQTRFRRFLFARGRGAADLRSVERDRQRDGIPDRRRRRAVAVLHRRSGSAGARRRQRQRVLCFRRRMFVLRKRRDRRACLAVPRRTVGPSSAGQRTDHQLVAGPRRPGGQRRHGLFCRGHLASARRVHLRVGRGKRRREVGERHDQFRLRRTAPRRRRRLRRARAAGLPRGRRG